MSKGSYRGGGSTIIGPSGWTTYDPAIGTAWTKAKRAVSLGDVRLGFLRLVVDAEALMKALPDPPSRLHDIVKAEVKSHGGVLPWARSQPRYAELKRRKEKKLRMKRVGSTVGSLVKSK